MSAVMAIDEGTLDVYRPPPSVTLTRDMILSSGSRKRKKKETVESYLRKVTHLTLQDRNIEQMQNLSLCKNLSVLYLHENVISKIHSLNGLTLLTHLFLQNNDIQKIEAIDHLVSLEKLYLGGNRIQVVEGLANLSRLEELHVENQRMPVGESLLFDPRSMMGLQGCLRTLNASGNYISSLAGVSTLAALSSLNLKNNNIEKFKSLEGVLRSCYNLRELEVSDNPLTNMRKFRERIIVITPNLESLNNRDINSLERQFLINWRSSRKAKSGGGTGGRGVAKWGDEQHHPNADSTVGTKLPPIHNRTGFSGFKKQRSHRDGRNDSNMRGTHPSGDVTIGNVTCSAVPANKKVISRFPVAGV